MSEARTMLQTGDAGVDLATEIAREHVAALAAVQSAVDHAHRCGVLLRTAKQHCVHGEWLPWLTTHCPAVSERTAQRYMRLAEHWPELEAKASCVSDLPLREALALLAEPRPEPEPVSGERYFENERPLEPGEIE